MPAKTPTIEEFMRWFEAQGFRNFHYFELTNYFFNAERKGVHNDMPPRELWDNIVPTLRVLDTLRDRVDRPIVLTSSYRSPQYNKAVGGEPKSFHMQFKALDFVIAGMTPKENFAILKHWRDAGVFKGGLGLYTNFVHIDTRGYNATW